VHDDSVQVGRLQNFKAWSPEMVPDPATTTVGMEYFCDPGDALWSLDDDALIDLGIRELSSLGFARADEIGFGRVIRAANAYPVYDEGYTDRLATLRRALGEDAANLQAIGRSGMHRYNNQDHSMMTGLLAARNLLGGSFDPWQVNAEAAYLEG
jgi:protoporphyrinogen oxidase